MTAPNFPELLRRLEVLAARLERREQELDRRIERLWERYPGGPDCWLRGDAPRVVAEPLPESHWDETIK